MKTLPELARGWSVSLDALRELVRRDPALKGLGTRFGPTRTFGEVEAEQIRVAFEAKQARKKTVAAT